MSSRVHNLNAVRVLVRLLLALPTCSFSCSPGNTSAPEALVLHIAANEGQGPEHFLAVVSSDRGDTETIYCPHNGSQQENPTLSCIESGIYIDNPPSILDLTIKARGYEFINQTIYTQELVASGNQNQSVLGIALDKLAPFEENQDYATGFSHKSGLKAFEQMAYTVDTELGPAQAIKFYIRELDVAPEVYFQNTIRHPLHYDFARTVLSLPQSLSEFEARTYHGQARTAIAGTLVRYLSATVDNSAAGQQLRSPVALTFFPGDDLVPAQAALVHRLIEERLGFASITGGDNRVLYIPAGTTQESQLEQATDLFASRDIGWILRAELYGNTKLQILNPGLAYGTLKRLSPEELESSVVSFRDILVLTRLPNALPVVGGTITEELQTPLAHVNLAARNRGTPNLALLDASQDPEIAGAIGKLVRFEVKDGTYSLREVTREEAREFWREQVNDPVAPDFSTEMRDLPGLEELHFADSINVGAKAANLAELTHVLGAQAPYGFAIPFYYYEQFLQTKVVPPALCDDARQDCLEEGRGTEICAFAQELCVQHTSAAETLWEYVDGVLENEAFNRDSEIREAVLDGIRFHIRHIEVDPEFAAALNGRMSEVFGDLKARLRSSTNAEDLPNFSGAGLYESVSAYASGSKLASDQVRKVWASVWNWRAFEERSFWNIDHRAIRMGVAVNQAFPDEAANGVLITQNIADPLVAGMYVNVQVGEVPVTNPENGAVPEVFSIIPGSSSSIQVACLGYSSLYTDAPILTASEISDLYQAANKVQHHFAGLYEQSVYSMALDLEFKFHGPERALFIKQVRPYIR